MNTAFLFLVTIALLFTAPSYAQKKITTQNDCPLSQDKSYKQPVYTYATTMPVFPGGIMKYLSEYLNFPEQQDTLQSHFTFRFVIDADGSVMYVSMLDKGGVLKQSKNITPTENAMLGIFKKMPKWIPGKCGSNPVAIEFTLPLIMCFRD